LPKIVKLYVDSQCFLLEMLDVDVTQCGESTIISLFLPPNDVHCMERILG